MYGYVTTVAMALLVTPIQKFSTMLRVPPPRESRTYDLIRSKAPYVIAGFTVNTRPGFRPVHRPVGPDSLMISLAVSMRLSPFGFDLAELELEGSGDGVGVQSC